MEKVVIVGAARTPIGKFNGRLKSLSESTLCGLTMKQVLADTKFPVEKLNEVVIGNAKQTSEPSNLARYAVLDANFPFDVSAYTVQQQRNSGGQAIAKAFWSIKGETNEIVLAGGAESMSQIPIEIQDARFVFNKTSDVVFDPIERQVEDAQPTEIYSKWGADKLADKIGQHNRFTPEELLSHIEVTHEKAEKRKKITKRMLSIEIQLRNTKDQVSEDYLGDKKIVAAPADGAASLLLMSESYAKENDYPILAEIISLKTSAGHPIESGVVDANGVRLVLEQANLKLSDIDVIDLAEPSAVFGLAYMNELASLGLSEKELAAMVNPYGSFLASGIPGGATGPIQCVNVLDYLEAKKKEYGLVITSSEGGQTMATLIRRRR